MRPEGIVIEELVVPALVERAKSGLVALHGNDGIGAQPVFAVVGVN